MPLTHVTKIYAVEDAKIAKLTADPTGGSATYATSIDVPGIKEIGFTPEVSTVELRGDNKRLDQDSKLVGGALSVAHAKLSFDALAVLVGGTVADSGTTPNQKVTYTFIGTDSPSYFKLEGKTPTNGEDVVGGDLHMTFYKCKLTSIELGFAEEDYRTVSFEASCVFQLASDKLFDIVLNETVAVIT